MSATSPSTSAVPSNWNIANGLTALRIALVPLFAALLLHGEGKETDWRIAATVAFAGAVATDRIDGELARSRGLVTNLGKIADPIADKALIGAALISLSVLGELWWAVTVLILARELGITLLRFVVIRHGVMPAGRGGKAKTVVQSAAILLYIAPLPDPVQPLAQVIMVLAVFLTVATGLDYMLQAYRMREGSERTRNKRAARLKLRRGQDSVPMSAADLIFALSERGQTVAVAESLTGGMICSSLIEIPGASAAVRGGVVAYATELKHRLLDVDGDLLARNGPVDPDVAAQMALGVRERLGADWGLSTTGVAGPDPQDGVAPGRVYLAIAGPLVPVSPDVSVDSGSLFDGGELPPISTRVLELDLHGDRAQIRGASTEQAIGALLAALREVSTAPREEHIPDVDR